MMHFGEDKFKVKFEIADCDKDTFSVWMKKVAKMSNVTYKAMWKQNSRDTNVIFNVNIDKKL